MFAAAVLESNENTEIEKKKTKYTSTKVTIKGIHAAQFVLLSIYE